MHRPPYHGFHNARSWQGSDGLTHYHHYTIGAWCRNDIHVWKPVPKLVEQKEVVTCFWCVTGLGLHA